jgi:hypothetical protein
MKVVKANDVPTQEQKTNTGAINEVLVAQLAEKFDSLKMMVDTKKYPILLDKDPNLGVIKIQPISGTFAPNEIVRDISTNEFATISNQVHFKDVAHHYEDANGYTMKGAIGATPVTNQEYEFLLNDKKAQIKAIRPQYVQSIADQFIDQIKIEDQ